MVEPIESFLVVEVDKVNIMSMRGEHVEGSQERFLV
jgi:hypothetical protein